MTTLTATTRTLPSAPDGITEWEVVETHDVAGGANYLVPNIVRYTAATSDDEDASWDCYCGLAPGCAHVAAVQASGV